MNKPISIEKALGACITIVVIIIMGFLVSNNKNKVDQSAGARNAPVTDAVKKEIDPTANIDKAVLAEAFAKNPEADTVTVTDNTGAQKVVPVPKKVFLMGGEENAQPYPSLNDVLSSTDGIMWNTVNPSAQWAPRGLHSSVFFKNQLWVMGGLQNGGSFHIDLWASVDGITWKPKNIPSYFELDTGYMALVPFKGNLYLIGEDSQNGNRVVWTSSDGLSWNQLSTTTVWTRRNSFRVVNFDNHLWILGGRSNVGVNFLSDIWKSPDGITWTHVDTIPSTTKIDDAPWAPRSGHEALVFKNEMWVIGGINNSGYPNDVWSSKDGITWTPRGATPWSGNLLNFRAVAFNNQILIVGGFNPFHGISWISSTGTTWTPHTNTITLGRVYHSLAVTPLTFGQKPDLISWDLQWKDSPDPNAWYSQALISKQYNNPVSFMITIKNDGTGDAILPSNTVMRLYKDSVTQANIVGEFNTATTPYTIVAGGSMDFYFTSTKNASNLATLGTHNFILYADKTNKLDELDETNNTLTTSFSMIP